MRLIERYVLVELVKIFGGILCITTLLLLFVGVLGQVREYGLGPLQVLHILPFVVPSLLPYAIPATFLLALCMVYGRIAGDLEFVACKASGLSPFALIWPGLFAAALLSVGTLVLMDQVIPWSQRHIERIVTLAMEDVFLDQLRTQNKISLKNPAITITVTEVRGRTLIWPLFRYSPHGRGTITMQAREAEIHFDLARQEVVLRMQHGHLDIPGQTRIYFETEDKPFPLPIPNRRLRGRSLRLSDVERKLAEWREQWKADEQWEMMRTIWGLTTGQFAELISPETQTASILRTIQEEDYRRLRTEWHQRYATASSCFFFALLGSPIALLMARKEFLTTFFVCFAPILVIYYPLAMMAQNFSKTGRLDPSWAVWIANSVMGGISLYFWRRLYLH